MRGSRAELTKLQLHAHNAAESNWPKMLGLVYGDRSGELMLNGARLMDLKMNAPQTFSLAIIIVVVGCVLSFSSGTGHETAQ